MSPRLSVPLLIALVATCPRPAAAVVVLNETFDSDVDELAGLGTWEGSYCSDPWRTDMNGGVAPNLDAGCEDCDCSIFDLEADGASCAGSDPLDNHIQAGNKYWQNYVLTVKMQTIDDDAVGVVFRYLGPADFYLFLLTRDVMPELATGCENAASGAALVRVGPGAAVTPIAYKQGFTHAPGAVHRFRVTVVLNHLKVEFDLDGDGQFAANEVFFDGDDALAEMHPTGAVGLYSFRLGMYEEEEGEPADCGLKPDHCWFDDVTVDLLPPNNTNCGKVAWEGECTPDGGVQFCDQKGQLQKGVCPAGYCCRYAPSESFYTCVLPSNCSAACKDDCAAGKTGCSSNLTHTMACGQGDGDPCLEPVFTACPKNSFCQPSTGKCTAICSPQCSGKDCGDDGCGGSCGQCAAGKTCEQGKCKAPPLKGLGEDCTANWECAFSMCVHLPEGDNVCSKACASDEGCPDGFLCQEASFGGKNILACAAMTGCQPDCDGKECGDDGCDGECGKCGKGFDCKGGVCKAQAGATCASNDDCSTGPCLIFPSGWYCTAPCSTDSGCPEGWECSPWMSADTPKVCAPPTLFEAYVTCQELADCVDGCPSLDKGCKSNCFFMGSDKAKSQYSQLWACAETSCFQPCAGQGGGCVLECLSLSCFQAFAACFPGSSSCQDAVTCMLGCDNDETCTGACYEKAQPAAKKQLIALMGCLWEWCGQAAPSECLKAALADPCKAEYEGCTDECAPFCEGALCGDDGCGGSCGQCLPGVQECKEGQCVDTRFPVCDGKECGDDGCEGSCGTCGDGFACTGGSCLPVEECQPHETAQCVGELDLYWFDSCGQQQELAEHCELKCQDGACVPPETEDVLIPPPADQADSEDGVGGGGGVVISAGQGDSEGCRAATAGAGDGATALLLLLGSAVVGLRLAGRRRRHA